MIQIGPKWTEVDLMDRSKSKWTKLDQSGLELTIILIKRACNSCCAQQGEVILKKKKKNKQTNKQTKQNKTKTNKQTETRNDTVQIRNREPDLNNLLQNSI